MKKAVPGLKVRKPHTPSSEAWRSCGKPVDRPFLPLDWLLRFRNDVGFGELVVSNEADRANDIVRAVQVLRQRGMAVGFPMQTADGQIIFPVGKDLTLTADQILELLERGELNAEGVRKIVETQAVLPSRKNG